MSYIYSDNARFVDIINNHVIATMVENNMPAGHHIEVIMLSLILVETEGLCLTLEWGLRCLLFQVYILDSEPYVSFFIVWFSFSSGLAYLWNDG